MRILFATTRLGYSGAPKMMAWVANQMAKKGHEVHLVTFFSGEQVHILNEEITIHSLKVEKSGSRLIRNTTGMLKTVSGLHKLVRKLKPNIVVSFLDSVGYAYLFVGRLLTKCKFIVSERSDPYSWSGGTTHVRSALMGFAHGTVFQTQGAQKFFSRNKGIYHKSTVIPNPVVAGETVRFLQQQIPAATDRDKRIVTVGRLSLRQKRQDVLLDAFKIVHDKHPEYKLVIYGDGPDSDKIQAMIDQAGLSEIAILAGRTDHVEEEIFRAGALALTSDFEGIPNALIEALSIGVPCVSTDCSPGGAALLIRDGENGFLVPRGDAAAIAQKLLQLVENPQISDHFSTEGPKITEEFSEERIADLWEQYLLEQVSKANKR